MTMMRDHKMYTFRMTYSMDYYGHGTYTEETTKIHHDENSEVKAIAKSQGIAIEAIKRANYTEQKIDFKLEFLKEEDCPVLCLTFPY